VEEDAAAWRILCMPRTGFLGRSKAVETLRENLSNSFFRQGITNISDQVSILQHSPLQYLDSARLPTSATTR